MSDNQAGRKMQKAALYSAFRKEGVHFLDHPLTFTYWLHGGGPATGSDALDITLGSGVCLAHYTRERFQGFGKPFKVDRFEMAIPPQRVNALLEAVFKNRLFDAVYPAETQPPIADILQETWEFKSESTDLQATFFHKFPEDLAALRTMCKNLMSELETQNRGASMKHVHPEESIGTATMSADKTIILDLRAKGADGTVGDSRLVYPVGHAQYKTILKHLGGLKPGEHKLVRPFPEDEGMRQLVFGKDIQGQSLNDYEKAGRFKVPAELSFAAPDPAVIDGSSVLLKGVLTNASQKVQEIIVFPVSGHYPFGLELIPGQAVSRKPPPPGPPLPQQVPPPPMIILLPPHSQVLFEGSIDLDEWIYSESLESELRWTFHYWIGPKPSGTLKIKLPARGAKGGASGGPGESAPKTIRYFDDDTHASHDTPVSEVPERMRFVYLKNGVETNDPGEATEKIPVVEVHKRTTGKRISITEYGPHGRLLRTTDGTSGK